MEDTFKELPHLKLRAAVSKYKGTEPGKQEQSQFLPQGIDARGHSGADTFFVKNADHERGLLEKEGLQYGPERLL
jgi:hypothetical protein